MKWYYLELNPEAWRIGPLGVKRAGGKMIPYVGQDQQLHSYKRAVAETLVDKYGIQEIIEGPVDLLLLFWRQRDEYTTQQARTHRKHEVDATNLQKSTEDALQGVLYKNDKDNLHVQSYIVEQGPDVQSGLAIRVGRYTEVNYPQIPQFILSERELVPEDEYIVEDDTEIPF